VSASGFKARYPGTCDDCDGRIKPDDLVAFNSLNELVHLDCPDPLPKARPGETSCPRCFLIHPEGECDR
jgi:hypothetical protein